MEDMHGENSKRKPLFLYWLYEIIGENKGLIGLLYTRGMLGVICLNLVRLTFKEPPVFLDYLEKLIVSVFVFDYICRWI